MTHITVSGLGTLDMRDAHLAFRQRNMETKYIVPLVAAMSGAMSACVAQVTNTASPWLPTLTVPLAAGEQTAGSAEIARLTGHAETPVTVWVDGMDVNGDKREDAVITIAKHEGAGARGHLRTHRTYVVLGSGEPNAVFQWKGAKLWFSIETYYGMNQTRYPDVAIRRQFFVMIENGQWAVKIRETRFSNQAGDSGTRGMVFDSVASSSVLVARMKDWKPKLRK